MMHNALNVFWSSICINPHNMVMRMKRVRLLSFVLAVFFPCICAASMAEEIVFIRNNTIKLIDTNTTKEKTVGAGVIPKGCIILPTWVGNSQIAFLYNSSGVISGCCETNKIGVFDLKTSELKWINELDGCSTLGYDSITSSILAEKVIVGKNDSAPRFLIFYNPKTKKTQKYQIYEGEPGEAEVTGSIEPHRTCRLYDTPKICVGNALTEVGPLFDFYDLQKKDLVRCVNIPIFGDLLLVDDAQLLERDSMDLPMRYQTDFWSSKKTGALISVADYSKRRSYIYYNMPSASGWMLIHQVYGEAQFISPTISTNGRYIAYAKTNAWVLHTPDEKIWIRDVQSGEPSKVLCAGSDPQFRP